MALPFGKYQLLKKLAAGGMGQVFLARTAGAQGFEKLLVIKRILPHLVEDEEFLSMFFDEARLTARLNHPNIVQIFDLGEVEGSHYLAMEYVAGEDLRRVDREAKSQGKAIPIGATCRIIADAAAGLDYAHKARDAQGTPLQLIHRDVSPQNILVGFDGGVKLIDFGVAKAAGRSQQTATGILKGKYAYMSPEQVDGLEIDHRSDIFALGVVFWEILAGKRLFKGDSDVQTMRLVRDCQVQPPSELNPAVPAALDPLVLLALSREPARRYPDAAAFRMALEDFIVSQHIPASSAHLVTFLRDIYSERIAQENTPASFDELAPTDVLDEVRTPASARSAQSAQKKPAPRATASLHAVSGMTLPLDEDGKRRLIQRGALALVVLGLGGLALALGIPRLRHKEPPPPTLVVDASPHPVPDTHVTPPPANVNLTLVSDPAGARVQVDGRDVGSAPVSITAVDDAPPMLVTFSLPGFELKEATLSAKNAPLFSVQLLRKKQAQTKNVVHLGIKTGR